VESAIIDSMCHKGQQTTDILNSANSSTNHSIPEKPTDRDFCDKAMKLFMSAVSQW